MRQAIVIVLLIGAAFLGGAFINGPRLQWVSSRTLRLLGLSNGGEITAVELKSNLNSKIEPDAAETPNQRISVTGSPVTPTFSKTENIIHRQNVPATVMGSGSVALSPKKVSISGAANQPFLPSATLLRSVTKSSSVTRASPDHEVIRTRIDTLEQSLPPQITPRISTPRSPAILGSLAALLPPSSPQTKSATSPLIHPSSKSKPTQSFGKEWLLIESRMQVLGVRSFTIEGKPGGPVVCACVIPVVDHQAVTERFEADGDNILQAAQAVTRRAILSVRNSTFARCPNSFNGNK